MRRGRQYPAAPFSFSSFSMLTRISIRSPTPQSRQVDRRQRYELALTIDPSSAAAIRDAIYYNPDYARPAVQHNTVFRCNPHRSGKLHAQVNNRHNHTAVRNADKRRRASNASPDGSRGFPALQDIDTVLFIPSVNTRNF